MLNALSCQHNWDLKNGRNEPTLPIPYGVNDKKSQSVSKAAAGERSD